MINDEKNVSSRGGVKLLVGLIAIGISYVLSLIFFLVHDENFVSKSKIETAENWAKFRRLSIPSALAMNASSEWVTSLAVGWNAPEAWGVWSNASQAVVVLPPISDSKTQFCIHLSIGALTFSKKDKWSFRSFINGILISDSDFVGPGPYEVQGMVRSTNEKAMLIKFIGPKPKTPQSGNESSDTRKLSYFLNNIKITQYCGK